VIKFANFKPEERRSLHNVADTRNLAMSLMGQKSSWLELPVLADTVEKVFSG
jgi:hypothetical protein